MAILVSDLRVVLRGQILGNQWENVQWYRLTGAAFATATPVGVGEAYWNDVKTALRALNVTSTQWTCESVLVSEPGLTGQYGEYAIPSAEQQGTRASGSLGELMPPMCAGGVRLTVGSRTTRPGQKRFCGLREGDQADGTLNAAYLTLLDGIATKFSSVITLGAPVATGTMNPEIVRYDASTGTILTRQDVVGFVHNIRVTTQNSRKYGHGA